LTVTHQKRILKSEPNFSQVNVYSLSFGGKLCIPKKR
jgi:hypothetical protein